MIESETNPVITVDAWQNQRFKPMQGGWLTPFQPGIPPFSDIYGNESIEYSESQTHKNENIPNGNLTNGWEWFDDWQIDMSSEYGIVDKNGWIYGNNFESLIDGNIQRNRLIGEKFTYSLARRRRYIRNMICTTSSAKNLHRRHQKWIETLFQNMIVITNHMEYDYQQLMIYEDQRIQSHHTTLLDIDINLNDTMSMLIGITEKLQSMKQLLIERGLIELSYSRQLQKFASKWINSGDTDTFTSSDMNIDTTGTGIGQAGFFFSVSHANLAVSQRLHEFSDILSYSLPADVDQVILEVESIKRDCVDDDGPRLR